MNWRYIGISTLLFFLSTLSSSLSKKPLVQLRSQTNLKNTLFDAEHALAVGTRIPINCIDSYSLGLIPTLSESVRKGLIDQKQKIRDILQRGTRLLDALDQVQGIGPKTSQLIARYITDIEDSNCPPQFQQAASSSPHTVDY